MTTLVSTTDSESNMKAALQPGDAWKTPPSEPGTTAEPAAKTESVSDYVEQRNEEEAEKKAGGPEFLKSENKPQHKSGWEKRVSKLTKNWKVAEARAEVAERRLAEIEGRSSSARQSESSLGGNGLAQDAPQEAPPTNATQDGIEAPTSFSPTPGPSPMQDAQYNRDLSESARSIPNFQQTLAAADQIEISPTFEREIRAGASPADLPHVMDFLAKNPEVLEAIDRSDNPTANISKLAHDLKALRGVRPSGHTSAPNAETARQQQLFSSHNARVEAALKSLPDAAQLFAAAGQMKVLPHVGLAVIEMDNSDQIAIHLARHHDTLSQLNNMSPTQAAAKIGRIAEQLEAKTNATRREKQRPPAPLSPVGGSSAPASVPLDQSDMNTFIKARNKQEREWKARTGR